MAHDNCVHVGIVFSIFTAADYGDLPNLKHAIEHKGTDPNVTDVYGYTALHSAARRGYLEIVKYLLEKGANPNANKCGATPLHRAAFSGHLNVVATLINSRAEIDAQDTAIDDRTPLHKAANEGHSKVCTFLLQKGADKALKDRDGKTAFEIATNDEIKQMLSD